MKREDLPLVTPAQFKRFKPCWLETEDGRARYERVAALRAEWNALDVLDLEDVSEDDRLWAVLREAFLPPMLLHEFACRCAEWGLSFLAIHDPSSIEAIRVKRLWMSGAATKLDLADAVETAPFPIVREAASHSASFAARSAAWDAAGYATTIAYVEREIAWAHEVVMLRTLIDEWE